MRFRLNERQAKFAREVGSVVLGVLIALGIGEIADAARWQVRVRNSLGSVREELAGNHFNVAERRIMQSCVRHRLAAIGTILAEARRTHTLPQVESIDTPGVRPIESTAFDVAKSEGVLLHIGRNDSRDMALAYLLTAENYGDETRQELDSWTTLQLIENARGPIDSDLLATILDAWIKAKTRAEWIALLAQQGDDFLTEHDIAVEYNKFKNDAGLRQYWRSTGLCRPLIVDGKPFAPHSAD